jgi:hypothetical protein
LYVEAAEDAPGAGDAPGAAPAPLGLATFNMKPLSDRLLEPAVPTAPGVDGAAAELWGLREIQPVTVMLSAFAEAPGGTAGGVDVGGRCAGSCALGGACGAEVGGACDDCAATATAKRETAKAIVEIFFIILSLRPNSDG